MPHPQLMTLQQWTGPARWRAVLPHSCAQHAVIWLTRGQGRCLLDGRRRGIGVHNAICIPAGHLFAIDPGAQTFGLVCLVPPGGPVLMPDEPQLLRIRDTRAQADLTALLDAMQREQNDAARFADEALTAHASLLTVWLRRAMIAQEAPTDTEKAADRLVAAYAALLERDFASGKVMQDYARELGVTPTHLTRSCKASAGMTASALLTGRILHAALDLLETGDYAAKQIATTLGFRSAAYFSRFIQHHTGQTPSTLRRAARRAPELAG
ncbi:MAG: AraC family transcriptional regulator [Rhodobacteraceae bacterium]|nr:AraC family transcriptional regulator [Paracoccaceae bacterium]